VVDQTLHMLGRVGAALAGNMLPGAFAAQEVRDTFRMGVSVYNPAQASVDGVGSITVGVGSITVGVPESAAETQANASAPAVVTFPLPVAAADSAFLQVTVVSVAASLYPDSMGLTSDPMTLQLSQRPACNDDESQCTATLIVQRQRATSVANSGNESAAQRFDIECTKDDYDYVEVIQCANGFAFNATCNGTVSVRTFICPSEGFSDGCASLDGESAAQQGTWSSCSSSSH
jgi:hypothetical protein